VALRHLLAVALATSFAGVSAVQATSTGVVAGVVKRGPIMPVCVAEQPCDGPAVGVVVTASRAGVVRGRTTTDAQGRFRLRLAPGVYAVRPLTRQGLGGRVQPLLARVAAGRVVRLEFHIDTGIR
jgi:hypothetical protein